MTLLDDDHSANVAVDLFSKPSFHWDGITKFGVIPVAASSANAFVP
jgi:hypothetical protein